MPDVKPRPTAGAIRLSLMRADQKGTGSASVLVSIAYIKKLEHDRCSSYRTDCALSLKSSCGLNCIGRLAPSVAFAATQSPFGRPRIRFQRREIRRQATRFDV